MFFNKEKRILRGLKRNEPKWENKAYVYYYEKVKGYAINKHQKRFKEEWFISAYGDTIIAFIKNIRNGFFREESTLFTYLIGIFNHKYTDQQRIHLKSRRIVKISLEDEDGQIIPVPDPDTRSDVLVRQIELDDIETLKKALKLLGANCYDLIFGFHYYGYNLTELAKKLGLGSSDKAKRQKYDCIQKLKNLYNKRRE